MNTLTVLCLAVAVACTSSQLVAYPRVYGYPGILGSYPTLLPHSAPITLKTVSPTTITLKTLPAAPITYKTVTAEEVSPITYNVAPVAPIAPVAPVAPFLSKFHAQDELGQYSFGYYGGPSSRAETRDAFGRVSGSYNYVDSEGEIQTQHYVADALGFRVSGTNLPVAPDTPEVPALIGPEPVMDTPEVVAAKAAFKVAYDEAAAAAEAAPDSRKKRSVVAPAAYPYSHHPLRFSYAFTAPLTYNYPALPYSATYPAYNTYGGIRAATTYAAAPATVRDATLLRVVHNPGHAVSYRVD